MHSRSIHEFVRNYAPADAQRLCFAWNGKHAEEFGDENQALRFEVTEYVLENPGLASVELIGDLFVAHSAWAREAWGAPRGFAELGALLLTRGGPRTLPLFGPAFTASFDTFGACHTMNLDPVLLWALEDRCGEELGKPHLPERQRKSLEASRELFQKLRAGTAGDGWGRVSPDLPASNIPVSKIRVVGPAGLFWRKMVLRIKAFLGLE